MRKTVVQSVKISKIMAVFAVFLISFLLFPLFTSTNLKSLYAETDSVWTFELIDDNSKAKITGYTGGLDTVTIPDTVKIGGGGTAYPVTSIGAAFKNNATIKNITIPSGVTGIQNEAFYGCTALKQISITGETVSPLGTYTLPSGLYWIGNSAFQGCILLTSIDIRGAVQYINQSTFNGCSGLTSITIPSTVKEIKTSAFYRCTGLTSITIPSGVTYIGNGAFWDCSELAIVTFKGAAAPEFDANSFKNVKADAIAYVPAGSINVTGGYYNNRNATDDYPFYNDSPLTLKVSGSGSGGSGTPRSLTPDEWVTQNLNMGQLVNHYGATSTGFLGMLYDNSMLRIPDTSGLNYWNEKLNLQIYGANFVAEHFLFSDEIGAKVAAMTNEEYVNFLYTTLLSRNSDTDGYNNWLGYLNSGFSKEETLRAFLNNEEWINICKLFNVTP